MHNALPVSAYPEYLLILGDQGPVRVRVQFESNDGASITARCCEPEALHKLIDPATRLPWAQMHFDDHLCHVDRWVWEPAAMCLTLHISRSQREHFENAQEQAPPHMNTTSSRYAKTLAHIQTGRMSRDELQQLGRNARLRADAGDHEAEAVLQALTSATCVDSEYVFLGFCPDAQFEKRQDIEWRQQGHCSFDFFEDKAQTSRFQRIMAGDLIVLKKRHEFGKTMRLYGHGRALSSARTHEGLLWVDVQWSNQTEVIEVPLMGCNTTVDVRSLETLRTQNMPELFFDWLRN